MSKKDEQFQILSVYLSSAGKRIPYPDFFLSQFHSLIHRTLSDTERKKWQKDIEKIVDFLHESIHRSNVRSYVFFSSGKNLWEVLDFEFELPPSCRILKEPYFEPLEESLNSHQKYLVLLVDRKKARLFTVNLGKIEEKKDIFVDMVPQNVKAKKIDYGRDDKIFRHIEDHLHNHLKLIADATKEFLRGKDIHFIIVGGHREMIPKIKKHLSYPFNKMVLGEFVTELNIPLAQILLHSKKIALGINKKLPHRKIKIEESLRSYPAI